MEFTQEELDEFKVESTELLSEAEKSLLIVEKGGDFKSNYDSIFRAFHTLKGAAGMLELDNLQQHMHQIEHLFQKLKDESQIDRAKITFFLEAIDAAKSLLNFEPVTFSYNLPQGDSPAPEKPKSSAPEMTSEKDAPLVYIIDDEEDVVEILQTYMRKYGLRWKGFTNPQQALDELEQHRPSIVLSDMKMPKLSGLDVLKAVKQYNREVPVIFISGYLNKEMLIEALAQGIDGVLEKPFREPQVIAQVTASLHKFQMWQLLNRTIDLILFQFKDVEEFLSSKGKNQIASILKNDIESLLLARRELKNSQFAIKPPSEK
jgi:CheY-like chemotaxis protein